MIDRIGSSSAFDATAITKKIMQKWDTAGDGKIDVTDLQAVSSSGSSVNASQIINDLDTNGDQSIDSSDLESTLSNISNALQKRFVKDRNPHQGPPDPSEMFKKADANGDGVIDEGEFKQMGPENADASVSAEIFASLDSDKNGSIDESENTSAMKRMGPPPRPPKETDEEKESLATVSEVSSTKNQSIVELLSALQSSGTADEEDESTTTGIQRLIDELKKAMQYGQEKNLGVSSGVTQSLFSLLA